MVQVFNEEVGVGGTPNLYWNSIDGLKAGLEVVSSAEDSGYKMALTGYGWSYAPSYHVQQSRGTLASPSQCLAGDTIFSLGGRPWGPNGFRVSTAAMVATATEDTGTTNVSGSCWTIQTAPNGGGARRAITFFGQNGNVGLGSFTYGDEPQAPLHIRSANSQIGRIEGVGHFPVLNFYRDTARAYYFGGGGDDGDFWIHSDGGGVILDGFSGKVVLKNLPTSASGLVTGQLWKDGSGFLKVA